MLEAQSVSMSIGMAITVIPARVKALRREMFSVIGVSPRNGGRPPCNGDRGQLVAAHQSKGPEHALLGPARVQDHHDNLPVPFRAKSRNAALKYRLGQNHLTLTGGSVGELAQFTPIRQKARVHSRHSELGNDLATLRHSCKSATRANDGNLRIRWCNSAIRTLNISEPKDTLGSPSCTRTRERMMMLDTRDNLLFAHKANIERYRKILGTFLTAKEEGFVKRRLAEEQTALDQLADRISQ